MPLLVSRATSAACPPLAGAVTPSPAASADAVAENDARASANVVSNERSFRTRIDYCPLALLRQFFAVRSIIEVALHPFTQPDRTGATLFGKADWEERRG